MESPQVFFSTLSSPYEEGLVLLTIILLHVPDFERVRPTPTPIWIKDVSRGRVCETVRYILMDR